MERKGILLVDDEALALKYFAKAFGKRFPVYSASSATDALRVLDTHHANIGVIVTDQRMPESTGVELLKIVRNRYPETARILTTAYTEFDVLVSAINVGAVHSFVAKPWALDELEDTLLRALNHHDDQALDAKLVEKRIDQLKSRLIDNKAYDIGLIAARIGHYVHNALCPLTFLLDQLIEQDHSGHVYSMTFLRSVRTHIQDVAQTLKDLEQASRPVMPEECEIIDLERIVDEALSDTEILRNQKRLRIDSSVSKPLPRITGSASQIKKLFRFMIAEEIVSLPADSQIRLRLSAHEADGEVLGANVEFEDFIPLTSEVRAESLLHPFNLRGANPREFGVFLTCCYFIARHHGGSLNVRIKDDSGLSFSFFLPTDHKKIAPPEMDVLKDSSSKPSRRRPRHDR